MPGSASNRVRLLIWLGIPLIAVVVLVSGIAIVWEARTVTSLEEQLARQARENGQLLRRLDALTRAQAVPAQEPPPAPAEHVPRPDAGALTADALAAAGQHVQRLRETLAQSSADITRLQAKVTDLESRIENVTADNHRLSTELDDGRRNLADASQTIETLRSQLKTNAGYVADLETANSRLKEEAATGKQSAVQTQQTVSDLEGVFRRREMYLNDILRRYKEITEQYRAMSGVRDSRDREAAPVSSAEISRIQNTIALAEEDLKQIYALNAQAQRLQKKLPAK